MMKVIINDTIKTFWESVSINGMQSPQRRLVNQKAIPEYVVIGEGENKVAIRSDGEIEVVEGDAGILTARVYGKDKDLVKLVHVDEVTCKCDNGIVFKGIIKELSDPGEVAGTVDITIQLYRL